MKRILLIYIIFLSVLTAYSQNFTGQWKGYFADKSTSFVGWGGEKCEYVLELECNGSNVTGYSYTYFNEGGNRYYTICKLKGKVNNKSKYVEVTETERTKTNVPYYVRNCFQIHKLTFFKKGDEETLEGSWIPAPNQEGNCGYGSTVLSRRVLKPVTPQYNKSEARVNKPTNDNVKTQQNKSSSTAKNQTSTTPKPPVVKKQNNNTEPSVAKNNPPLKMEPEVQAPIPPSTPQKEGPKNIQLNKGFEKRNSNLLKTIEIENETFKVDLYDNGDIDGDTVSLFYNGHLILAKKKLSANPISLDLKVDNNQEISELTMYAENLGEIPPNTALMIVTDGNKRYEVRITSDLQKSGVIRFTHKK